MLREAQVTPAVAPRRWPVVELDDVRTPAASLFPGAQRDGLARHRDPRAELLRLDLGPRGQRLPGDAGGEAEVVLDA